MIRDEVERCEKGDDRILDEIDGNRAYETVSLPRVMAFVVRVCCGDAQAVLIRFPRNYLRGPTQSR
jgi:hypothetical protein